MRLSGLSWPALAAAWLVVAGCQSAALTSAKLYLQEDQPTRARQQLEKALVTAPDDPQVHYLLGRALGMEGEYRAMAAALDESARLSPKFATEIGDMRRYYWVQEHNRGVEQMTAGDLANARVAFETATIVNPDSLQSWLNLAGVLYQLGEHDASIATYQQVAALQPGDSRVLSNLGIIALQERRYEVARDAFARLVQARPEEFGGYVNLGMVRERMGDSAGAEESLRRAVSLAPDEPLARQALGNFYWNEERFPEAREQYIRAVELDSSDVDGRFNLAMVHLRLEEDDAALPLLQQLSEETPDNGIVWQQLSYIYARKDMGEERRAAQARADELGY